MMEKKYILLGIICISFIAGCISSSKKPTDETCYDGVKNQDETGVDCGGSCPPCKSTTTTLGCEGITNVIARSGCYIDLAVNTENPDICSFVNVDLWKDTCLRKVAIEKEDVSICERINNSFELNECYEGVALKTKDPSICKFIEDSNTRDECYYTIALKTKKSGTCRSIKSNSSRYRCFAMALEDPSFCDKIPNQNGKDWCYHRVATIKPEVLTCKRIIDSSIRDECYMFVAEKKIDKSICDNLENKSMVEECFSNVDAVEKRLSEIKRGLGLNESLSIKPL